MWGLFRKWWSKHYNAVMVGYCVGLLTSYIPRADPDPLADKIMGFTGWALLGVALVWIASWYKASPSLVPGWAGSVVGGENATVRAPAS